MTVNFFGFGTPVGGTTPTITPAPPGGTPIGAMMLMQVSSNLNGVPLPLGGWDLVDSALGGVSNVFVYSRIRDAGDPATYTVTRGGVTNNYCAGIVAWTSDSGRPLYIDAHASVVNTSAATHIFPSVTTTKNSAGLNCFGALDLNLSSTPDALMNERWDVIVASGNRIYLMTQVLTAAGGTGILSATSIGATTTRCVTVAVAETSTVCDGPHISLFDGTTTIDLNVCGGGNAVLDYEMNTSDTDSSDLEDEPRITETLNIMLVAATGPLLQTMVRSVQIMLVAAKQRQKKQTGVRVYLQLQIDGEASTWRAEIVDGDFQPDEDMLKIGWPNLKAEGALMVTHRVWEGPEIELQLSTSNATAATGGQTIYNHDDSGTGHDNWVQIASTQVGGVLPTPVKLVLTNNTGSGIDTRNFFLATNAFSDPANFVHILEGESRISGFGTVTVDANDSGGNYNNYTFTTTGFVRWDLSAAQMQRTQGRSFRLFMRMHGWSGANFYVKPVLKDSTGNMSFFTGEEILLGTSGSYMIDLGAMPFPNGGYRVTWPALVLELALRCTGAGIFNIDFMQLTPLDAYQHVAQRGLTIANGDIITIDNIEGPNYESVSGPIFTPLSGALKVFPGVTQKIIILNDEGGSSNIARTFSVRAYIRERRLTV